MTEPVDDRPKRQLTEEERHALTRKRLGIQSVDKEKLWRERQGNNALSVKKAREQS